MDFVTSALIASWVAIVLLALVVSGLIRQVHQLSRGAVASPPRAAGVAPGTLAPGLDALSGGAGGSRGLVLLFLSADCRTCAEILTEAEAEAAAPAGGEGPRLRAVYATEEEAAATAVVPVVAGRPDLFDAYDVVATPFAVVVGHSGRVQRSEPLGSRQALRRLLADVRPRELRSTP